MATYILLGLGWLAFVALGIWTLKRWQTIAPMRAQLDFYKNESSRKDEEKARLEERSESLYQDLLEAKQESSSLKTQVEETQKRLEEQKLAFQEAQVALEKTFRALASEALDSNSESFLKLAAERLDRKTTEAKGVFDEKVTHFQKLVEPIRDVLGKVGQDLEDVEKIRSEQFGRISQQLMEVSVSSETLRKEASSLSSALRRPGVRGSWGELQLKRVVELAGMSAHVDFDEQANLNNSDEKGRQKPDMVVHLPNHRSLIVDSKAVFDAYLDANEAQDAEVRKNALDRHAKNVRSRVVDLSRKAYWDQFENTPDFVILFIPNEALLMAAAEADPSLIEDALQEKVVIATPTTLVAVLKAVAYGWQQDQVAENAQKVIVSAKELYERLGPWMKHLESLGKNLNTSVKSFNDAVGSLESRVLPSARRFQELGLTSGDEIPEIAQLDRSVREIKAAEPTESDQPPV